MNVLVLEDEEEWRDLISGILRSSGYRNLYLPPDITNAEKLVDSIVFDLIVADLCLEDSQNPENAALAGIQFLNRAKEERNRYAATVILTAHPAYEGLDTYVGRHHLHRVLPKANFSPHYLLDIIQEEIFQSRLAAARDFQEDNYALTIQVFGDSWRGCWLEGPNFDYYMAKWPLPWDPDPHSTEADQIGTILRNQSIPASTWRQMARGVGDDLFREVLQEKEIGRFVDRLFHANTRNGPTTLRFSGPKEGLRVPFELIRRQGCFLGLQHVISRQIFGREILRRHSERNFSKFFGRFFRRTEQFRILLIGADAAGTEYALRNIEEEIQIVEAIAKKELGQFMGVRTHVESLIGREATPGRIKSLIQDGYHVFHYSGHGIFSKRNPELSGLVLWEGGQPKHVTASELQRLMMNSDLRLVFLNCCLAAQTAADPQHGDFHGAIEAVIRAGVPWALGHRWEVHDQSALRFAKFFYQNLWRSLNPELSVLAARQLCAEEEPLKRDDPIWASSILVSQDH